MTTKSLKFFEVETLGDSSDDDRCVLHNFVDGIRSEAWRLFTGDPLASVWPLDARIFLTEDDGPPRFDDLVSNTSSMLIVSEQFRKLIQEHTVGTPIEFLPIGLRDSRNRQLSSDYTLVNPLGSFPCIDYLQSDIVWDAGPSRSVVRVNTLVMDGQKASTAPQLFRPADCAHSYIIGTELARAMYDAQLSNIVWTELAVSGK